MRSGRATERALGADPPGSTKSGAFTLRSSGVAIGTSRRFSPIGTASDRSRPLLTASSRVRSASSAPGGEANIAPYRLFCHRGVVEVAGIEPASFGLSPGILRAQPVTFLGRLLATGAGRRLELAEVSPPGG